MAAMAITIYIVKDDGNTRSLTYNLKPSSNDEETSRNIDIVMMAVRRHFEQNLLKEPTK
jgi:hypothetical protein